MLNTRILAAAFVLLMAIQSFAEKRAPYDPQHPFESAKVTYLVIGDDKTDRKVLYVRGRQTREEEYRGDKILRADIETSKESYILIPVGQTSTTYPRSKWAYLDRAFGELSPEQQAKVRRSYAKLSQHAPPQFRGTYRPSKESHDTILERQVKCYDYLVEDEKMAHECYWHGIRLMRIRTNGKITLATNIEENLRFQDELFTLPSNTKNKVSNADITDKYERLMKRLLSNRATIEHFDIDFPYALDWTVD